MSGVGGFEDSERVADLPYAEHLGGDQWSVAYCQQACQVLSRWHAEGLVDTAPEEYTDGKIGPCREGRLELVDGNIALRLAWRSMADGHADVLAGAERREDRRLWLLSDSGVEAARKKVRAGVFVDPEKALAMRPMVYLDRMSGALRCDEVPELDHALAAAWPANDVVSIAKDQGLKVFFQDRAAEEAYASEMAKIGEGVQPEGFGLELFDYQRQSVAHILSRRGAGLFLSPGLGKTAVAVAAAYQMLKDGEVERAVITMPAAVRIQWKEEIVRYLNIDPEDIVLIGGGQDSRNAGYEAGASSQWVIVHHDVLDRDLDRILPLCEGAVVVVDEAHKGANWESLRSKAMSEMCKIASRRIAMTGTPVPNHVGEWYTILNKMIEPGWFGNPVAFMDRYQYPGKFGGWEGARRLDELADRSRPLYTRWTKETAAPHLPPLEVRNVQVKPDRLYAMALENAHQKAAKELAQMDANRWKWSDSEKSSADMTAVGMLRAMCSSPALVRESESTAAQLLVKAGLLPEGDGPKLDLLREMIATQRKNGARTVIFTYSTSMLELISKRLREDGSTVVEFSGQNSMKERDAAVKSFTSPDGADVFLATDAAAEGLNLGKYCNTLINFDVPWTPGRLDQRANRIHRVDGTHPGYLCINLTIAGSIETSVLRKVESKAGISDILFGEASARNITGRRSKVMRQMLSEALS